MTATYGFRITADVVAIICFVFALLYFFICDGAEAFATTCRNLRAPKVDPEDNMNTSVNSILSKSSSKLVHPASLSLAGARLRIVPKEIWMEVPQEDGRPRAFSHMDDNFRPVNGPIIG